MIWAKTEAGRVEMQTKALIKERAQRNLLLLIDGQKSEEMLLANVVGIKPEDFAALESMGLIEQAPTQAGRGARSAPAPAPATAPAPLATAPAPLTPATAPAPLAAAPAPAPAPAAPEMDYARFTEKLTELISGELGLRGFTLTLALEKAGTVEELLDVAKRVIEQIGERKGARAAESARRALFGR